jgi:hypothetical protein
MKRKRYFEIAAEHSANLRWITILPPLKVLRRFGCMEARSLQCVGIIMVHRPDTFERLRRFLHECAHCKLHAEALKETPYHWLELDAEQYAFE